MSEPPGRTRLTVTLTVNGSRQVADVEAGTTLLGHLRDGLGLTAANHGCDTTSCGACTVLLDGRSVKSCTVLAAQADGREVVTAEGLAADDRPHPVQESFREHHALQCGYCTPGMVLAAVSLLREQPDAGEREVRCGLRGNLCRCTGYHNIIRAVLAVAARGGPDSAVKGDRDADGLRAGSEHRLS
ncbi:(2Fe-2S)-binding protein [Sphaerimonospora mesophila]|uniref:(2Fe-2S)-binding protein n=1 Tax=Sphaerimonospora mesophila TaxID=37483 RepID=UPI0006E34165